jgi:cysteine-rich repeat protein
MNKAKYAFLAVVVCLALGMAQSSGAATIQVTANSADEMTDLDGICSLREAIEAINLGHDFNDCTATGNYGPLENDTINIPAGTYTISALLGAPCEDNNQTGDFDIHNPVRIIGAGAGSTFIDGAQHDRVFDIPNVVIVEVAVAKDLFPLPNEVVISNLTVRNGSLTGLDCGDDCIGGGGIRNGFSNLQLRITDVAVSGNVSDSYTIGGGGIANCENLVVERSTISTNIANETMDIASGMGGGILSGPNTYTFLVNSTISGNNAAYTGGGIGLFSGFPLGYGHGNVFLRNVTMTNNTAAYGGGIVSGGDDIAYHFDAYLRNSIVAQNIGTISDPDCMDRGVLVLHSEKYNLVGDDTGCDTQAWEDPTDLVGTGVAPRDPHLLALADNGGPTWTHALDTPSTAIDGANPAGCFNDDANAGTPLTTDQRGEPRPANGKGGATAICDIGAYEYQPLCGDNIVQPPEECDNGINNSDTVANACRTCCKKAYCGDNVIDTGEQCDDGVDNGHNGHCSATCELVEVALQLSGDSPWNCSLNPAATGSLASLAWLLAPLGGLFAARRRKR